MPEKNSIVFGPVPSRRLGKSIGINNIIPKYCTYSCIYCQIERTHHLQIKRQSFYNPNDIVTQTEQKIKYVQKQNEDIDYLTIVSNGEPTIDVHLGKLIKKLRDFEYPIAVITNASLLYLEEVRSELALADWVSLKIDAVTKETWKQIDRPHGKLILHDILEGIEHFSAQHTKILCTETMLINNINDSAGELKNIAEFIAQLHPNISYLSIPTRPPSESWVKAATEETLTQAYHYFMNYNIPTEYLIGYEGNEFAFTGDAEQDLLSITAVHPMRQDAVEQFLQKADENWRLIERLIKEQKIVKHRVNGHSFYTRKLPHR